MCEPVTASQALLAVSAVSAGLQYQQGKQQQKAQYEAQKRQNEIARKNALQRYASEQLRIRQVVKQSQEKGLQATLKARKARAVFISSTGESGVALGGSIEGLLADYYRTQGNYVSALNRNLGINVSQYERNLEAIKFGQESQSTYVQPPNPELLFASSALNVANTYYGLEAQKESLGLLTNKQKKSYQSYTTNNSLIDI